MIIAVVISYCLVIDTKYWDFGIFFEYFIDTSWFTSYNHPFDFIIGYIYGKKCIIYVYIYIYILF